MSVSCQSCKNTYWIDSYEKCPKCAGSCYDMQSHGPCTKCGGKGKTATRVPCPVCNMAGDKPDKRMIIK
jgi:DnaJ-class molecular chaperone